MTVHRPEPRVDLSPVNDRQRARLAKTSKPVKMGISALCIHYMPSAAGAARGDQRGTPPLDSPEDRGPEARAWAHHDAKSDVVVDVARAVAAAIGTARALMIVPERPAPQDAAHLVRSVQLFAPIVGVIGIGEGRFSI